MAPSSADRRYLKESVTISICPWKGTARYYTVTVDGAEKADAAWYYPAPRPAAAAAGIRDHVAFRRAVTVAR